MAKNNEVQARVRVTIGGVAASKKNLEVLQETAENLKKRIASLQKEKIELSNKGEIAKLKELMKELARLQDLQKANDSMISQQKSELVTYKNILDNLTNSSLAEMQKALRGLQNQMKQTITMNDVKRYSELKAAYDQLLASIEQLSGKVPNISYVLKNVGQVADKTLADSIGYMEKLISTTDKTTKRGRENIKQWTADLKTMREEMAARSIKVLENPQHYSVEAIQQAVASLKKLQPALKLSSTEWDNYSQKIKEAEQYLKSYDEKQKQLAEKAMRQQTDKVLANPAGFSQQDVEEAIKNAEKLQKTYTVGSPWWIHYKNGIDAAKLSLDSFNQKQKEADELARKKTTDRVLNDPTATGVSEQAILDAIKHGKELQKQLEYGGDEWKQYAQKIKFAEDYLKSYDAEQRRLMETQKAQAAILNAPSVKTSTGAFNLTKDEAKEAAEAIEKYINTLNMSTQADEIKQATDALNVYNEALGKVKETSVDVSAILKDPKLFSSAEIEQGIKQLEEAGKAIKVGNTSEIQKNINNINKLKNALADSNYNQTWLNRIVKDATAGKASIANMEKAIALIKDKMRRTTDKTVIEKLRQDLDKLNPALDETKFNLNRVEKTLGNIKGSNLGSLKEAAERLKLELNDVNIKMKDFEDKAAKLKLVNAQIKELEAQTKNVSSAWDNAISRLKNWVLIYAGSLEIWNKMVESYRGVLRLSDAMADVRKVTGLSNDEVKLLTDQVQELDTRISNEKLMQAAVEAGRIGLKTREEVIQFTRASAITLTALDELDARSITSVMKLNGLLGETARLGVQQAILSTASSINELSMASSAAQQPIIDFSRRFGGIAAQANISTAEVLGLGATIDALGQPIEMSSTALNKFTTALLSNGKAIAEDTGLSEDYIFEMTRQGKTIELMIEVLGKLNNMGGIGEISKYMGDMGGDGARMTAVVSALAANLGFLRQNLDLSKQSFEEGISVINEYNLKNENAAALVERIANEIKEAFVNSQWVTIITSIVKGLQQLISFMLSGSTAAKVFNSVLILVIGRMLNATKAVKNFNLSFMLFIQNMKAGGASLFSLSGIINTLKLGIVGLGRAIKGVFLTNPFGWALVAVTWIADLVSGLFSVEEQAEKTKSAMERANEAFEEESYKLKKLKDALDLAKESGSGFSEIVSTLNRDYGKQIGYVLDLAASYREVAGAIDLATAAKRKQILQGEKDKNFQGVQDEFREATNEQINALKNQIGIGSVKGQFEDFADSIQKELYNAIATDLNKSAATDGTAKLGAEVEAVLKRQAKAAAETFYRTTYNMTDEQLAQFDTSEKEAELLAGYKSRMENLTAIEELASIYSQKVSKLNELDEEVDRQLVAQSAVIQKLQQNQIDIVSSEAELANKAAKDFTADDENTLTKIISLYESMLLEMKDSADKDKYKEISDKVNLFKARQREVMLAFIENPLRDVKMKVGQDGKLYKEVLANGKYQYEAVQKLDDANLDMLRNAYKKAGKIYDELVEDNNRKIDSKVMEQAQHLSGVRIAIKKHFAEYGQDIDDEGNLKLRNTEYRDGSERDADKDARAAYKALLDNMEEYYGKRKEIILARLLSEGKTIKEKNLEIKKWEVTYRQGLVDMQSELLGKGESFEEKDYIRDLDNYAKAAALIRNASKTFQDKVANDMQKNRNKIIELQFLPGAGKGGGDAEKGIRKAYTAILKNIEEYYSKQKQIVEADYLNSAITTEEKNRRIEELELQHWQTRITMQREVLHEMGENGEEINWFNEELYIRDLDNFKFVKDHMLDESHHYQDTVRADMEKTIHEQDKLLSKHKQMVDKIILGNDYQAQVDKEMQEALETAGLFWGEMTDRTAKHAAEITTAMKEAAKDSYAIEADKYIALLKENKVFGENIKSMTTEQQQALIILLQQFHDKTIEADKKFADQRRKITQQMRESGGYENEYNFANASIKDRQENLGLSKDFGATSDRKAYEEQYRLTLEQWALEEWKYQMQYELAVKAGETEEQLLARRMEMAEMEKEMQRQVTDAYLEEYNRRAEKLSEHAEKIGDFAGVMASSAWNSVEDRKKAGEELLKYIAQETSEYIRELLVRKIKEEVLRRQGLMEQKKAEKEKHDIEQKGVDTSIQITEIGGKLKTAVEEQIAGNVSTIAESTASQGASLAVQKAQVDTAAGAASGAAKTIGELGWWGIPLIAAIQGVLGLLLNMALGALSSTFGKTSSVSNSSKRLATGMLTYASGRYPVEGDDGRMYSAQYEPVLRTGIYDGGKGKAHMALFSEVMPEMVVSGRTTRIIQEDFPGLMNAILMIDKYGTLPQQRRVRRYAGGNVDDFDVEMVQNEDGTYSESPAISELRQSNQELREAVAVLTEKLSNPIPVFVNMYGPGGIYESMDKANKFYQKNRIK